MLVRALQACLTPAVIDLAACRPTFASTRGVSDEETILAAVTVTVPATLLAQSNHYWAPRFVPPDGAPNVLVTMTDHTGFGVT